MGRRYGLQRFNQIHRQLIAPDGIKAAEKLVEEYSTKGARLHAVIVEDPSHESIIYLSPEAAKQRDIIVAIDGNSVVNGIITGEHDTPLELLIDGEWIGCLQRKELNEIAA
jgi:hypothetical protein